MGAALAALFIPFCTIADACGDAAKLIKNFEGFRPSVYICQAGEKAIGYGFTDSCLVSRGTITREEAEKELTRICGELVQKISNDLNGIMLKDTELAALVSFVYNVGWRNYRGSTLRRLILNGKRGWPVAKEFNRWVYVKKSGKKIQSNGLKKRRAAEAATFAK